MLWLAGCASQSVITFDRTADGPSRTLTVFAAARLPDAFNEIGAAFSAGHPGVKGVFNFAGSQQLRTQLEQGATADVFASANDREMNAVLKSGLAASDAAHTFARNRLTVILPKANPAHIQTLGDLARPGLKIILAAPGVPVGGYSLIALNKLNAQFGATYSMTVLSNVVSYEDNVRQVVAKIQLNEGDAGIVYTSDVTPAVAENLITLSIPDEFNVLASYPIAALSAAPQPELAAAFVEYVLSAQGQLVLQKWGLISP